MWANKSNSPLFPHLKWAGAIRTQLDLGRLLAMIIRMSHPKIKRISSKEANRRQINQTLMANL